MNDLSFRMTSLPLSKTLSALPQVSEAVAVPPAAKIVVLDDDPTGTQTVHSVPVLTTWEPLELERALNDPGPCFFILTNSRAYPQDRACRINHEIGGHLAQASRNSGCSFIVVSRGDSTLRGHYPAETDALAEGLGVAWDGTLIIPAFFAGGRITIGDVHYVADVDRDTLIPVGETEFARDKSFGYRSSNLRAWVEEKTMGRVAAADVLSISIEDLRVSGARHVARKLLAHPRGCVVIVNAVNPSDLAILTQALADTEREGRRYLFRTAADFVSAYAGISKRPLLTPEELTGSGCALGGLVVAGSYVGKTSAQLEALARICPSIDRIEVQVDALLSEGQRPQEIARCSNLVDERLAAGQSVTLFTSRSLVVGRDSSENLSIGKTVSSSLVSVVRSLRTRPRWLIAKGGITSSDLATDALGIRRATVLGQAAPGVPVWLPGEESKWPGLPYIIFPGNVGGVETLARLAEALEK